MKLNQKDWSCPKKREARLETIITQYYMHFGGSLPPDRQYWTICGQCTTANGQALLVGSEFDQVIESGLILPHQFHGVEINKEIHDLNAKAFSKTNWHNNDFYRAMVQEKAKGNFKPGIVNVDLPQTPDGGAAYVSKIMAFLTDCCDQVLLVVNLIMRMRYYKAKDGNYFISLLEKYPQFRYSINKGNWSLSDDYYHYEGAGDTGSRTWMGSFIFVKR